MRSEGQTLAFSQMGRGMRQLVLLSQDKFFTQLHNSADGFGIVADFFGRGLLNNTSVTTAASAAVPQR